jgi:hypothetical protein
MPHEIVTACALLCGVMWGAAVNIPDRQAGRNAVVSRWIRIADGLLTRYTAFKREVMKRTDDDVALRLGGG